MVMIRGSNVPLANNQRYCWGPYSEWIAIHISDVKEGKYSFEYT